MGGKRHSAIDPDHEAGSASGFLRGGRARQAAFLCLAAALGLILDRLAIELIPGSFLSLGMAAVLAASARSGPLGGFLVLLVAKSGAMERLGNLVYLLPYGLEAIAVALARRRRPRTHIVVVDAVFWPLIGLPIFAIAYRCILGVSLETVIMTLLKVWLAGLFNAYVAGLCAESRLVDRILGERRRERLDMGRFIMNRLSVLLLPLAFLGLFGTVSAFWRQAEKALALRVATGVEAARHELERSARAREPAEIAAALEERNFDPDGRYELARAGEPTGDRLIVPWIDGLFQSRPAKGPHPTDLWRNSEFFGEALRGGIAVRYDVAFEPTFLTVYRLYSIALGLCLGLIYGSYAIAYLTARALARRTRRLVDAAQRLPARIERGEPIAIPPSDVEELADLSGEFEEAAARLRSLVSELRASRDGLESAVAARTAELERRTEEVRLLLAKVEGEREAERKRVARELHDELGQGITALGMALYLVERHIGDAGGKSAEKIAQMHELLDGLSESMRRLIADLRPSVLDRLGLPEALDRLAAEASERAGARVESDCALGNELVLDDELKSTAYRIAQEALSNALRHSGSPIVRLRLRAESEELVLEVEDEGSGFDADSGAGEGAPRRSFGILGMSERCRAMGGRLSIASKAGEGTLVRAALPLAGRSSDAGTDS